MTGVDERAKVEAFRLERRADALAAELAVLPWWRRRVRRRLREELDAAQRVAFTLRRSDGTAAETGTGSS